MKWEFQRKQRADRGKRLRLGMPDNEVPLNNSTVETVAKRSGPVTIGGFLRRSQQTLLDTPWQVLQVTNV